VFLVVIRLVAVVFCMLALHADAATQSSEDPLARGPVFPPDHYPIFSTRFTGSPSPFHETVSTLVGEGAKLQPSGVAQKLWRQGLTNWNDRYRLPIFVGSSDQPVYAFSCLAYGRCGASGLRVHLPAGALSSEDTDHHLIVFDNALGGELDGWGGDGSPNHACKVGDGSVSCSWGGFFPFSGNGLDGNSGNSANDGGYAFGLFVVTASEILQGHIDHALGMVASCLDNPHIYPADTSKHTDTSCSGGTGSGNPQYGQLVHLKSSFDVAASAYSPECKIYLTALQTYGAYTFDTNNGWGIALATEDTSRYASPNPWYTRFFPEMARYGDGTGSGRNFTFPSCLNRLTADDIEVYDIAPGT
jgi:hypothetical protein